jgi:ATP-dependent Lon protease
VIVPRRNKKDLEDIPKYIKKDMEFIFADTMDQVLKVALKSGGKGKTTARKKT